MALHLLILKLAAEMGNVLVQICANATTCTKDHAVLSNQSLAKQDMSKLITHAKLFATEFLILLWYALERARVQPQIDVFARQILLDCTAKPI